MGRRPHEPVGYRPRERHPIFTPFSIYTGVLECSGYGSLEAAGYPDGEGKEEKTINWRERAKVRKGIAKEVGAHSLGAVAIAYLLPQAALVTLLFGGAMITPRPSLFLGFTTLPRGRRSSSIIAIPENLLDKWRAIVRRNTC
ncbi:uncharacterized protein P174DRAFT_448688 [Aspergillus novofumigatus IBT 16806]|uniref:Uncharacterized protein n=1 Tax=Aspergillus novofumigatus (strain IBT 16806) TaxID=1392255 RepID=A0A2I1CHB9_ASPN1|nr:uncharacterized protein P174DRAFT_448688 [Aspergillus novofumigatus IBT 16806]PKX97015.1 hypothetical protein P174DRAFT_448688 [Aspergillus novofumigatus IBT 16806]